MGGTTAVRVTVSPLAQADTPVIADLARRIWPAAYAGILTDEQIANLLLRIYGEENLRREMADGHRFWAAYENAQPVGYASAYKDDGIIWLKKLYVLPDRQGRGIGKKLIDAAVAALRPARELRLLVNGDNLPAQRFYAKTGFTCIGEMPVRMGDFAFTDRVFSKPL